jgi:hypothetical protein
MTKTVEVTNKSNDRAHRRCKTRHPLMTWATARHPNRRPAP